MNCPRCTSKLNDFRLHGCTLKSCPHCEGTWYPGEALGRVTDHSLSDLEKGPLQPTLVADKLEAVDLELPISCPRCSKPMMRYRYSMNCDVVLDECIEHGVWLDDGELGSLMTFLEGMYADVESLGSQLVADATENGGRVLSSGVLEALHQVHSRPR